jgi:hypothetical protein
MEMYPIETGTLVKIWQENRGHDYMVIGLNRGDRTLSLIKNNCINSDGVIHGATQKMSQRTGEFHKEIPIEDFLEGDGSRVAPRIKRVIGTRLYNRSHLSNYVRRAVRSTTLIALKTEHDIYAPIECVDARAAITFA